MANGPSSQVPSLPQRGGGKTYSQMVNEQLGLIQQQRAANFEQRIAQEQKNREFRTEQLQNIYDFDVSGLAVGDAKALGEIQKELSNSLNPGSELSYSDPQQLIADSALIKSAYNEMKRWGQTGATGRRSYQDGILQPDNEDGTVNVGNEESLKVKNEVWDKGAFKEGSIRLVGPPGDRRIVGIPLDIDGKPLEIDGKKDQEINFFEHPLRNRADQFWRMEIGPGDFMDVRSEYASNRAVDQSNVESVATNRWNNNPRSVQNKYRIDKARRNDLKLSDLYNDDKETFREGYTDEDLIAEYINEAVEGVGLRRSPEEEEKMSATARQKNQALAYRALFDSIKPLQETITVAPSMVGGDGFSELRESISFLANEIDGTIDITPFLPESLTKTVIDNPKYEDGKGAPETILVDTEVYKTPSSIAITADGLLILSGLGNVKSGESIGEVTIDPNTPDGRKAVASLSGLFRDAYGVSFNEFLRSLNMDFEVPETAAGPGFDVNSYKEQQKEQQ